MDPMVVNASTMSVRNVLGQAGVATLMEEELTNEEYMEVAEAAQGASWGYTNLGIANVSSGNLNIRTDSSKNAKLVGKLPKDAACEVIEITEDGWAHISSGNVEGYVSAEYLLVGPEAKLRANELIKTVVKAATDGLRVREEASVDSSVITQIAQGEELEYIETLEGWYKISIDGQEGYVSSEYSEVETKLDTAITMTELLYGEGVSDVRVELCEYAKQFVGNPYVWGGTSLTKGADCSGFVLSVFKKFGVKLSHHSGTQAKEGTKISASELQAGDLVFYGNSKGTINHVAIYIGGGQVIHASSPKTGIKISQYKYRTPVKYVRVLQD
ncbi:MAG: C40 family peptidase [Lachnospiraceae bacterium]|nr:C40 family peptidase [Lachnospiraceae bacterium]